MSVPKGERKESPAQFLETARELRIYTQDRAKRLPNREIPYEGKLLATASYTIFQEIVTGNNIRVRFKENAIRRLGYFNDATANLKALAAEIDVAAKLLRRAASEEAAQLAAENEKRAQAGLKPLKPKIKPLKGKTMEHWHGLIAYLKKVYKVTPTGRVIKLVSRKSKVRQRRKLKKLAKKVRDGLLTVRDAWQSFQSWRSGVKRARGYNAIKNMMRLFNSLFSRRWRFVLQAGT